MIKILFVCLSNICRSPTLQAVLQKKIDQNKLQSKLFTDSCGIGYWHIGSGADPRAIKAAHKKGYNINHTSKLFHTKFFQKFDYVLAVDNEIKNSLKELAKTPKERSKILLATIFTDELKETEIPDPYLKDEASFDKVVAISELISDSIISKFCV